MDKKFNLFVRHHAGTGVTMSVLGRPELTAFGTDASAARADLALTLQRLLEEDHGDLREATTHWPRLELRRVDVTLRARQQRRLTPVPMRFSVLVRPASAQGAKIPRGEPLQGAVEIFLPRLGLRQRIDDVADLEVWVEEFVRHEFFMAPLSRLRAAAYEGTESVETLTVSWRPSREDPAEEARAEREDPDDLRSRFPPMPDGLDEACRALHQEAAMGLLDRAFQRERELGLLTDLLLGSRKVGVLLLGPSGAGKSALVHELAARSSADKGPLSGVEIYSTSGSRIVAGMRYLGEWQARMERMIRSLRMRRAILHIENFSEFLTSFPANSGLDGTGYLGPAIASGDISVILEASAEDAARAERTHASFLQVLRPLPLAPLDRAAAWAALRSSAQQLGRTLQVRFEEPALRTAMDLTERFFPRAPLPGAAVSLLRAAGQEGATSKQEILGADPILEAFSRRTGFPRSLVDPQARLDPDEVLATLQRRVVGQDGALVLLRDLVLTLKTALADPRKPLGSFLLLGPTGVGKTESALALTAFLFGDERRLVRIDMSEFAAPGSAARLLGLYGAEGVLTRRVREQPFGVVLLDEIEKADSSVHDLLLQLLDEGRLTDVTGRAVDFTSTVVVMTSNLGAEGAGKQLGFGEPALSSLDAHYRAAAARFFRPELLNRIDHLVPYRPLSTDSVRLIVRRMLDAALAREGIARRGIAVSYEPSLIEYLAEVGMDPRYGARPLKRAIEQRVVTPLAWRLAAAGGAPPPRLLLAVERGEVTLREPP
jgi:ATP-dependent Clp protease ATP-binding subunit ClpC